MGKIPNRDSLLIGLAASSAFAIYMVVSHWDEMGGFLVAVVPGIPISFLFFMFSNPKDKPGIDWGMVGAMMLCVGLWPVILLALVVGRPWKDPKWVNRNLVKPPDQQLSQQ